jgi:glycosyltransferase involved in cell wall biosynthesis
MISVIIPTYNNYESLLNTIESVKNQTYLDIEIIVVDDNSTDKRYENIGGIKYIKIEEGTKEIFGYRCNALLRNIGMEYAKGEYIAFLEDTDIWMPQKLEIQINEMKENNIDMSCTDGYIGEGTYDSDKNYKLYNGEHYFKDLKKIYKLENDLPDIFNLEFVKVHNPIIISSICFKKDLYKKTGDMKLIENGGMMIDDKKVWDSYDYWKRMLEHTNCLYIKKPLFYFKIKEKEPNIFNYINNNINYNEPNMLNNMNLYEL